MIGIKSSGIHSNGLTLARKLLIPKYGLDYEYEGKKLWEWLLEPTRIYVKAVLELIENVKVHGLAHITGGAFSTSSALLPSASPLRCRLLRESSG